MMKRAVLVVVIYVFACASAGRSEIKTKEQVLAEVKAKVDHITCEELIRKKSADKEFLLIDVRTEKEYTAGHIEGAIWIPRGKVEFEVQKITKDPDAEIVLYCRSGVRSGLSALALERVGYKRIVDLDGGFKGWVGAGNTVFNLHGEVKVVHFLKKENAELK